MTKKIEKKNVATASTTSSTTSSESSKTIKLFGEYEINPTKKMSLNETVKFLADHKDSLTSPGQVGRMLVALRYIGVTDVDYRSMEVIVKKYWSSVKKSSDEVKTTHKSLASLMNSFKKGKIDIYSKPSRSGGSGRTGRTISDEAIDEMFKGILS